MYTWRNRHTDTQTHRHTDTHTHTATQTCKEDIRVSMTASKAGAEGALQWQSNAQPVLHLETGAGNSSNEPAGIVGGNHDKV